MEKTSEERVSVSARLKLIVMGMLLCLAVALTVVLAVQTVHAVQQFQQSRYMAQSGDVSTIRPWMTVPFISRVYHVPEPYLLDTLQITDPRSVRHTALYVLALRRHQTPDALVRQVQTAILTYRSQHAPSATPGAGYFSIPPPMRRAAT
jgi:hypothetical protein